MRGDFDDENKEVQEIHLSPDNYNMWFAHDLSVGLDDNELVQRDEYHFYDSAAVVTKEIYSGKLCQWLEGLCGC